MWFLTYYIVKCANIWKIFITQSQCFPSDQCKMLQDHVWINSPFKVQASPMDFNVTQYENSLIYFQIPHCNWPYETYDLFSFDVYSQLFEKAIKVFLPFPTIFVGLDIFHILQPKLQQMNAEVDVRTWLSCIICYICKIIKQCHPSPDSFSFGNIKYKNF